MKKNVLKESLLSKGRNEFIMGQHHIGRNVIRTSMKERKYHGVLFPNLVLYLSDKIPAEGVPNASAIYPKSIEYEPFSKPKTFVKQNSRKLQGKAVKQPSQIRQKYLKMYGSSDQKSIQIYLNHAAAQRSLKICPTEYPQMSSFLRESKT